MMCFASHRVLNHKDDMWFFGKWYVVEIVIVVQIEHRCYDNNSGQKLLHYLSKIHFIHKYHDKYYLKLVQICFFESSYQVIILKFALFVAI